MKFAVNIIKLNNKINMPTVFLTVFYYNHSLITIHDDSNRLFNKVCVCVDF